MVRGLIGPGRDGSSDDKISVDLKFCGHNTKVDFSQIWVEQDMVKTTFVDFGAASWRICEREQPLDTNSEFPDGCRPDRMAVFIHPKSDLLSESFRRLVEPAHAAMYATAFTGHESGFFFENLRNDGEKRCTTGAQITPLAGPWRADASSG